MSLPSLAPHSASFSAVADKVWCLCTETAFKAGWSPLTRLAEAAVVSFLKNIQVGHLVIESQAQLFEFPSPDASSELNGHLRVKNDAFWVRLCLMSDLGFSEAFMYGDVECDDLISVFRIFLENKEYLPQFGSTKLSSLFTLVQRATYNRFANTLSNTRANISAHYDISNEMFAGFLSEDMTYSCAIFPELDGDLDSTDTVGRYNKKTTSRFDLPPSPPLSEHSNGSTPLPLFGSQTRLPDSSDFNDPLYLAQLRKLRHIIDKLRVPPADPSGEPVRILEIGSGWGALAIKLAEQYPHVEIDTLTLSSAQKELTEQRIASQGADVAKRIRVYLMDYRNMPKEWAGRFARFVSVEMIEAVGIEFLETYWGVVDWAMQPKDSVGVVQVITIPEARFETYKNEVDFIRKWVIFPGGILPTLTCLITTLSSASQGRFVVDSVSNIGPHYARTLREWRRRFEAKFDSVILPSLQQEYTRRKPNASPGDELTREDAEAFRRKWIYYYCYCEIGFSTRTLGDHIITFTREGASDYGCEVYS